MLEGIVPATFLLPHVMNDKWSCVACDQYTSQPEYWKDLDQFVADSPSTLRLMLPECYLEESKARIPGIHETMKQYLEDGTLVPAVEDGMILICRTTESGSRLGLVCAVDLEAYDYVKGTRPLIRPTEETIASRLPPRMEIRRNAPVELSHIMLLADDPGCTLNEYLYSVRDRLRPLYDVELSAGGGHLTGWAVEDEWLSVIEKRLSSLKSGEPPMMMAVGDGNHSLATAKALWEELKSTMTPEEAAVHPARYAMAEIVNIHSPALLFEPIHRLMFHSSYDSLTAAAEAWCTAKGYGFCEGHGKTGTVFTIRDGGAARSWTMTTDQPFLPVALLQAFLDDYLKAHQEAEIDYIHGDDTLCQLAERKRAVGFLLPVPDKASFFDGIRASGVLPRKTFSMGSAHEKRYYTECRKIR